MVDPIECLCNNYKNVIVHSHKYMHVYVHKYIYIYILFTLRWSLQQISAVINNNKMKTTTRRSAHKRELYTIILLITVIPEFSQVFFGSSNYSYHSREHN